jgi:cytochrome c-type biogenesis protein CcmH/NrfG
MGKEKSTGYVKKENVYILIAIALLVGFLSGVVFAIYKSPGENGTPPSTTSQEQAGGHNLVEVENQVKTTPNDPGAWIHLGNAYFDIDQPTKAIDAYNKALELAPDNPAVLTDLGVMYRRNKQPDLALATFDKAIQADPGHEQSRLNKGVVLFYDKNDKAGAFKAWEELLSINPLMQIPTGQPLKEFMDELQKK